MARNLPGRVKAYLTIVIAAAAACAVPLALGLEWRPGDLVLVLVFSTLAIAAPLASISYRGTAPTRIVHQVGSSFTYPLLVLVDPGLTALVCAAATVADMVLNRRRFLHTAFNIAQLVVAVQAAALVRDLVRPERPEVAELSTVAAAAVTVLVFAAVNQALTRGVVCLANGWPFFAMTWFTRTGLLTETLCIVSGLAMAVFWLIEPWFVPLGAVPLVTLFALVTALSQREQALEERERELRSLQGFGLEVGAELDTDRVNDAALRVACEALNCRYALLARLDDGSTATVLATRGLTGPEPATVRVAGALTARRVALLLDEADVAGAVPALAALGSASLLVALLEIRDRIEGVLVLGHDDQRHAFDEQDVRRLRTLTPFMEVALTNARLVTELREMQSQLVHSEKMSALGIMVSGVAHELNNPLTAVLGYAELLESRESDERRRAMLRRVSDESRRAARIVQNLLTFSRKRRPEKTLVDVNRVIDDVLEFRTYDLRTNNIEIVSRLSPDLAPVWVDRHQFHQVLVNLVTNASQAIAAGRGAGRLIVESRSRDGRLLVSVSDDGPGIDPADIDQVFLPFFTTKDVGRGTGLGLSICYGIVEEHGGTIRVDSTPGAGATFTIDLPIAGRPAVPEPRPVATVGDRRPVLPFRGRALIVEDELPILHLLADALQPRGWAIHAARNGDAAQELIRELDFHVIVLDLRMPGLDGPALFEWLERERPELAARVIFATGDASGERSADFLAGRSNPVLTKPYDLRRLAAVMADVATAPSARRETADEAG